ncbi:MAG: hypothetical protein FJZ01_12095 [Candidatus Sericytochromatia bacterium]|nr:hypothetical protein [Candidatus Tanganyikabacteria bacterium]
MSGTIGTVVRTPAGIEVPISAGIDRFYSPDGIYDWQGELASSNHFVGTAQIADIIASASALVVEPWMAPRDAVSAATGNGNYTSGSVWGDMRLMLAAIAAWAKVQPESTWTPPGGGGGGGGGTTASGSVETVWPSQWIAVEVELSTLAVTPRGAMPTEVGEASNSVIVLLDSADFASGSAVPFAVKIGTRKADGSVALTRYPLTSLRATDWRQLMGGQALPPSASLVAAQNALINTNVDTALWATESAVAASIGTTLDGANCCYSATANDVGFRRGPPWRTRARKREAACRSCCGEPGSSYG